MTEARASSEKIRSSSRSPPILMTRGTRWRRAISIFSSSRYPGTSTTSIRSSNGRGMVSRVLAVAMKRALERSKSTSTKLSWNLWFCSGSRTSSNADDGSPLMSLESLSISSSSRSGLALPARLMASIMRPGIAPM